MRADRKRDFRRRGARHGAGVVVVVRKAGGRAVPRGFVVVVVQRHRGAQLPASPLQQRLFRFTSCVHPIVAEDDERIGLIVLDVADDGFVAECRSSIQHLVAVDDT